MSQQKGRGDHQETPGEKYKLYCGDQESNPQAVEGRLLVRGGVGPNEGEPQMIRTIVVAFWLTGAGFWSVEPPPNRQPTASATLDLHIAAKDASLTLGQQPHITATITNRGSAPVTLVLPGDGSESGWRTPLVGFSSMKMDKDKPKHPATVPLYRGGRCGNINALKSNEVFTLAPGKSKDLWAWIGCPQFTEPGTYSVVFYYANDPELKWRGVPWASVIPTP